VTIKNLEIVDIDAEKGELFIKGAVPGARTGVLMISTDEGKIEVKKEDVAAEEVNDVQEEVPVIKNEEAGSEKQEAGVTSPEENTSVEKNDEPKEKEATSDEQAA